MENLTMSKPEQIAFQIMTDNGIHKIGVSGDSEHIDEFMGLFATTIDDKYTINMAQKASPGLKSSIQDYVDKYAKNAPHLQAFRKRILDIEDDKYFLLIPYEFESSLHQLNHEQLLAELNGVSLAGAGSEEIKRIFDSVLSKYDVRSPPSDRRTVIGERDPDRKRCRFCGETKKDGATFKKVAHAISEALGNKNIIVSDECDACNEKFGNGIEPALIELLNINRTYVGVIGKNGHPKVTYKNGSMSHDGSMLLMQGRSINNSGDGKLSIALGTSQPFALVDCYKALCKFALSVIDESELRHLSRTIEWIKSNSQAHTPLPRVSSCVLPFPKKSPEICIYTRRTDEDRQLPHVVCEFRLGPYVYVYMLPFSDRDIDVSNDFFNGQTFTDLFSHYRIGKWTSHDYSSTIVRPIDVTVNFVPREQSDGSHEQ